MDSNRRRSIRRLALATSLAAAAGAAPGESFGKSARDASAAKLAAGSGAKSAELAVSSVYGRFASLKDAGVKELACRMEASVRRYERKPGARDVGSAGSAAAAMAGANDALKGAAFSFSMSETECSLVPPAAPEGASEAALKKAQAQKAVADSVRPACLKLGFHYFRNPLTDFPKDHPLVAQAGWYRLNFASGDYKLAAFLAPDLKGLREYSDGKDNQTDVSFRQEGEKLAPAKMVVKAPGKTATLDDISYEIKKGQPILSGFRASLDDGEYAQEVAVKLAGCKLIK